MDKQEINSKNNEIQSLSESKIVNEKKEEKDITISIDTIVVKI